MEYNFGSRDSFVYHENLQAEITKYQRYFGIDDLRVKKGDKPLKNRLESTDEMYKKLAERIKNGEPKRVARSKKRNDLLGFNVQLDHIYGFRSYDQREGILMTSASRVFYTVGSCIVGIEPNSDTPNKQYVFNNHATAVSSFDLYEDLGDLKMIASSEMSSENNILIWDPETLEIKASIKKLFERGVSKIRFSNDGKYLAVVGVSDDSTQQLIVLSFPKIETFGRSGRKDDKIQAIAKIPSGPVLDVVFDSLDTSVYFLVGSELYTFYFMASKETQSAQWGKFSPELLTCITYKAGRSILTSSIQGNLFVWDSRMA